MSESLEVQFARLEEQIKGLRQVVEGARYIADVANKNSERLAVHEERFLDLKGDLAQLEGRMESAVSRVEKSCNGLGELLRDQERAITRVENEQDQQTRVLTRREKWLVLLAGAFASGAITLLVHYLTQ